MITCKRCGTKNQETSNICLKCAQPLKKKSKRARRRKSDNIIFFIIVILSALLLIGASVTALYTCTPKRQPLRGGGGGGGGFIYYTVTFDMNCENPSETPEKQQVNIGGRAICPSVRERENFFLAGWYTEVECVNRFDFSTKISHDYTLYAYWLDSTDKTDTDGDGLIDVFEIYYGTDINNPDTDNDYVSDFYETEYLFYNPLNPDTDGDGIPDGDEEVDSDMLVNKEEQEEKTKPNKKDTDGDCLDDGKEVKEYKTNPLLFDTDGDGASDGAEIIYGTDPNHREYEYDGIVVKAPAAKSDASYTAMATIDGIKDGKALNSLSITESSRFSSSMPGYIGPGYDFNCAAKFDSAIITFEFDSSKGSYDEPTVYYFNEEEGTLEPLKTTLEPVDGSNIVKASAKVTHFSTYVIIDRTVHDEAFEWQDVWESGNNYSSLEIILLIDDSGSMVSNDPNNSRLDVSKTLIEKLPENSKIGVVKFDSYTTLLTPELITSKQEAISLINDSNFISSGGTNMYSGIYDCMSLFETDDDEVLKMIVVLSDGSTADIQYHYEIIDLALAADIKLYTVGLGSANESYFDAYLKPLASKTGGVFYYADKAEELTEIYEDISEKIDIETDSDNDGVPNYYEENMVSFDGIKLALDKDNPDTDGDGLLDGEEIVITMSRPESGKVKVWGKILSDPTKQDTDSDGIADVVDTAPFTKGLKGGIVGALTICSYDDGEYSTDETSGHAYLVYTSYVIDNTKQINGVLVDNESGIGYAKNAGNNLPRVHDLDLTSYGVVTISNLGAGFPSSVDGTWINNELFLFGSSDVPQNQVSLTVYITDYQLSMLCSLASENTSRDTINNSAAFAVSVWNAITNDGLAADSDICSPASLTKAIMKNDNYKTGAPMEVPMP